MVDRLAELLNGGAHKVEAYAAIGAEFGVSASTVKAAWRLVRSRPPGEWLDALVKNYKGCAPGPMHPAVWGKFLDDFGAVEKPQLRACWERTRDWAQARGLGPIPHEKTFQRRFKRLPGCVQVLAREGERVLTERYRHQERDRSGMLPLDSTNWDGRKWDTMVLWPDGTEARPTVSLIQDDATNFILTYEVGRHETGDSFLRIVAETERRYGAPKRIRSDNTRAAANKRATAGAKGRKRFKDRPGDVEGVLKRCGIEIQFTEVANGRSKGAEGVFARIKERTEKHPDCRGSYTGRSTSEKPANYGERAVPLAVFERVLADEVHRHNTAPGSRSKVAFGKSYAEVFEAGLQEAKPVKFTPAQRRMLLYAPELRAMNDAGEVFLGKVPFRHRYCSQELADYAGSNPSPRDKVVVRFDENDLSKPVLVETRDGTLIAAEVPRIEAGPFNSTEAARAHRSARRTDVKATKKALQAEREMAAREAGELPTHVPTPQAPTAVREPTVIEGAFGRLTRPTPPPHRSAPPKPASPGLGTDLLQRVQEMQDRYGYG